MLKLALDTATTSLSLALFNDDDLLLEMTTKAKVRHSKQLLPLLAGMLRSIDLKVSDLQQIIISRGPGSYTGLRIGVTVAKTLAFSQQIPLYSIDSLALLAQAAGEGELPILSLIDARRGNAFLGTYHYQNGRVHNLTAPIYVPLNEWLEKAKEEGLFKKTAYRVLADDWQHLEAILSPYQAAGDIHLLPAAKHFMRASGVNALVFQEEDAMTFKPSYLKLAEAEEIWLAKHERRMGDDTYVERVY